LEKKKIDLIIVFNRKNIPGKKESFDENDIALDTNLLVMVKLIHAI
jgi:hypothetical protein